ncbi:MAG: hypothetical protein JW783_09810 [Bacteroidales bacterium]|nr:hypothetical protein [Bacteroidales bacterium]MBN2748563.1 hypothetical protein [Bacteroidales bacterium]
MLLKFFRRPLPIVLTSIILLAIGLWVKTLVTKFTVPFYFDSIQMPLYKLIIEWIPNNFIVSTIIAFALSLIVGLWLLGLNSKHIIIKQRTYIPTLIYIIIATSILPLQRLSPAVFAAFFILPSINHLLSIYQSQNVLDHLYRAGFYVGLASLFYAPASAFLIGLLVSAIVIKSTNTKEILAAIGGFLTPWFFFIFILYIFDNTSTIAELLTINFRTEAELNLEWHQYIPVGFMALLLLTTGLFVADSIGHEKINVRKFFTVFFWYTATGIITLVFLPTVSYEMAYILAIPLAFQFSYYFSYAKNKFWSELLFSLIIVLAIVAQFI